MNLGELRDLVRIKLDDRVEPYLWSDEFIDGAINRAQDSAVLRIGGISDDYTPRVSLGMAVAGSPIVLLGVGVMKVEGVEISTGSLLPTTESALAVANPAWELDTGVPSSYVATSTYIRLHPIPIVDTVVTMRVRRGALVKLITDSQEPELPESYHAALLHWVLAEAYELPDVDIMNKDAVDRHTKAFEGIFGPIPTLKFLNTWSNIPARSAALKRRM